MTRREKLEEQYEDAYFALLMDAVAEKEGARLEELNDQLNRDPTAFRRAAAFRVLADDQAGTESCSDCGGSDDVAVHVGLCTVGGLPHFCVESFDYCGRTVHTIGNEKR